MFGESLQRALAQVGVRSAGWIVYATGVLLGVAIGLAVILVGLSIELLRSPAAHQLPDWRLAGEGIPLLGPVLVNLLAPAFAPTTPMQWLIALCAVLLVTLLITCALAMIHIRLAHAAAVHVADQLRAAIVQQAVALGGSESLGGLRHPAQSLVAEKCHQVEDGLSAWWRSFPLAVVAATAALALAMIIDVALTMTLIALIALIILLARWARLRVRRQRKLARDIEQSASRHLGEYLRGIPVAASMTAGGAPPGEAHSQRGEIRRARLALRMADAWVLPLMALACSMAAVLALALAGIGIFRLDISLAGVFVIGGGLLVVALAALLVYATRHRMRDADRSAAEILQYLDKSPALATSNQVAAVRPLQQEIRLENVRLADSVGLLLLDDVTCTLPVGSRIALVTTDAHSALAVANLLTRCLDPAAGRILWDGDDLRRLDPLGLKRESMQILSRSLMFDATIDQNIRFGTGEFSEADVRQAAQLVLVDQFVGELPSGYATILGNGQQLSSMQSYLLSLARAALRRPSLVLLEDAAGELTEAEEQLLESAIDRLAVGRTLILLSPRIRSLRSADEVLLLHEGKLVGRGPHLNLLQSSALYRHINYMRFNEFGAAVR